MLPAFTVVEADKVESFSASSKVVVLGYFAASASKDRKIFEGIAQSLRDDFTFGVVADEKALKKEKVKDHKIIMFKKFDEPKVEFTGDFKKDDIVTFIETKSIPVMVSCNGNRLLKIIAIADTRRIIYFAQSHSHTTM